MGFTKPKENNNHKNNNPKRSNFEEKTWPQIREKYREISKLINEDEWNPGNLESLCKIFDIDKVYTVWNRNVFKEFEKAYKSLMKLFHPDKICNVYGGLDQIPKKLLFISNALSKFFNEMKDNLNRKDIGRLMQLADKKKDYHSKINLIFQSMVRKSLVTNAIYLMMNGLLNVMMIKHSTNRKIMSRNHQQDLPKKLFKTQTQLIFNNSLTDAMITGMMHFYSFTNSQSMNATSTISRLQQK